MTSASPTGTPATARSDRLAAALAAGIVLALSLAACGAPPEPRGSGAARSAPFAPASATVPPGYHLEQCQDLRPHGNRGLALRLAVPDGYAATPRSGAGCGFQRGTTSFSVAFDVAEDLRHVREHDLDPFEGSGGDDDVSRISYDADARVLGGRRGEQLAWRAFNDGDPQDSRVGQAGGVRLGWTTRPGGFAATRAAWRAVGASVGLVRDDRSTCRTPRGAAWFSAPVPRTESFEIYSGRCHLYLQPGRESLLRYAEVVPRPVRSSAERVARLRRTPDVTSVRLEPGAARLAGRPADRLTWVVVRRTETADYQPAGTWRMVSLGNAVAQATWGATPEQWRTEGPVARRFFASVRPLP